MRSGRLRNKVTLQSQVTTVDTMGQRNDTWTDIVKTFAAIDNTGGTEVDKTSGEYSKTIAKILIRYQDRLSGLKQSDRVLHGTVIYDIQSINNVRDRNKDLLLVCERNGS